MNIYSSDSFLLVIVAVEYVLIHHYNGREKVDTLQRAGSPLKWV